MTARKFDYAAAMAARVGILSTVDAPLLPLLVQQLRSNGIADLTLIFDSKGLSEKNRRIFQERTRGTFDQLPRDFGGIPAHHVDDHNGCADLVRDLGCALLLNGGTPRKLGSAMLEAPAQGILNVHPGVLPHYRGATCVEWALYNSDPVGNSAHFMNEAYDEGPILKVEQYRFPAASTYTDIRVRIYREAQRLMAEAVQQVLDSGITPADCEPQVEGKRYRPIPDELLKSVKTHRVEAEAA